MKIRRASQSASIERACRFFDARSHAMPRHAADFTIAFCLRPASYVEKAGEDTPALASARASAHCFLSPYDALLSFQHAMRRFTTPPSFADA